MYFCYYYIISAMCRHMDQGYYNTNYRDITSVDIIFSLWMLYVISRCCFPSFECCGLYPYCCIALCYLLMRRFRVYSTIVFAGIMCIGMWQAALAIGQHFDRLNSSHRLFDITGSFGNPGQLGGFLAISIIATICMWSRFLKCRYAAWFFIPAAIQGYALVLSDSRAGWLSAMCGAIALWILKRRKTRLNRNRLILLFVTLIIVIGGLYKYKPQSADGRLLVWRVTADMIADKPILGHGIGGFNKNYMFYQADYFTEHPESAYSQYSDNIAYPYNEFLHVLADQGIIGLVLILGLLVAVLKTPANNNEYKAAIIGYIVFAQFSYPSYVPGLLVLFPILIASIQSKPSVVSIPRCIHWGSVVFSIILFVYVGMEYSFRKECRETIPQLFSANPSKAAHARQFAEDHYHRLSGYPRMADVYGQYVYAEGDPKRAMIVLKDLERIVPTSELFCDLGDLYKAEKDWNRALACYRTAYAMIPRRLTPVYKLFETYRDSGDTISAREQALKALSVPVRTEGTRTFRIKAEMKRYLAATN